MPHDPLQPKDDGKIGLPSIDGGQNKLPPTKGDDHPNDAKANDQDRETAKERKEAAAREQEILSLARKRFKRCIDADSENRTAALEDLKFKAGDQWPADIRAQRKTQKRPCLTINTAPALSHQVTNDLRQNRPAINISPVGDRADKEGARAFAGMINAIERDCAADIAYDTAITSAADIGFGYVRILTEYENSESMNRVVIIKRVRNSFSVNLDPDRQEPDGCDATFGFISVMMPRAEFRELHPDANEVPWDTKGVGEDVKNWANKDSIRIAEYFTMEHEFRRLVQLSNGNTRFYDDLGEDVKKDIKDGKIDIIAERESECQRVVWHKITALQILDTEKWPGKWIPIIEFIGEEIDIEGKVIRSGLLRNAKDAMRAKNYWVTSKTERIALDSKAPWLIAEGQDEGYEQEWKQANTLALPALHYVPVALGDKPVPPPQKNDPIGVPQGFVEAEQSAEKDIMATMGIRIDPAAHVTRYDESGKQLQEQRRNNDLGSFHLMDNASRSLRQVGRILVDLIPKIYDTKRVVTILQEDDTEERITIDPSASQPMIRNVPQQNPAQTMQPGQQKMFDSPARKIFNPGMGEYGVTVTIGPSYATKRIEAADQMMAFAKALPEKGALIAHLIAKYSDWPGADEIYRLLAKALPPNMLTPDLRDLPPQLQAFVQSLNQKIAQLMAERVQMLKDLTDTRGDREVRKSKVDKDFEAKLLRIMADMKKNAMEFDHNMVQTAVSVNDGFHNHMAKLDSQNPPQDQPPGPPVSTSNQPGTM